jgi:hypothetical protein
MKSGMKILYILNSSTTWLLQIKHICVFSQNMLNNKTLEENIFMPHYSWNAWGPSWLWSYGNWIYNNLCNQCLSPLKLWLRTLFMARCTRHNNKWYSLSVTWDRSVVFSSFYLKHLQLVNDPTCLKTLVVYI